MKCFLQKVNELLFQLKAACDYLDSLKSNANTVAPPELYEYLCKEVGVNKAWLDRFTKIQHDTWGKECFDEDDELEYHSRNKEDGRITVHKIDQLLPGQDTIRAIKSKSYKPKPLHFRRCISCNKVKTDISNFDCPYKYCGEVHKGKCSDCAPTAMCASCSRSGCICCFVSCSRAACTLKMCGCSNFDGWKDYDRGAAPGCSYTVPRKNDHENEEDVYGMGEDEGFYCELHKPQGAVKYESNEECTTM